MNPQGKSRYYTYIRPVLRNKTVKTYSSLIFSLVTITILLIYAIRPTLTTIVSLQKSIDEHREILENLNKKVSDLTQGRKNYEAIDPDLKIKLVDLLPYSPAIPSLINNLLTITNASNATVSGLQIQPIDMEKPPKTLSKDAQLKEVELTFSIQGTYAQSTHILQSLKNISRLIKIESVVFNKPVDSPLIMTVNAKALFIKNP